MAPPRYPSRMDGSEFSAHVRSIFAFPSSMPRLVKHTQKQRGHRYEWHVDRDLMLCCKPTPKHYHLYIVDRHGHIKCRRFWHFDLTLTIHDSSKGEREEATTTCHEIGQQWQLLSNDFSPRMDGKNGVRQKKGGAACTTYPPLLPSIKGEHSSTGVSPFPIGTSTQVDTRAATQASKQYFQVKVQG